MWNSKRLIEGTLTLAMMAGGLGCAADTGGAADVGYRDVTVNGHAEGLIARLESEDGAVLFFGDEEDGVFLVTANPQGQVNPLEGLRVDGLGYVGLYERLARVPAPEALVRAARVSPDAGVADVARAVAIPDALPQGEDIAVVASALSCDGPLVTRRCGDFEGDHTDNLGKAKIVSGGVQWLGGTFGDGFHFRLQRAQLRGYKTVVDIMVGTREEWTYNASTAVKRKFRWVVTQANAQGGVAGVIANWYRVSSHF